MGQHAFKISHNLIFLNFLCFFLALKKVVQINIIVCCFTNNFKCIPMFNKYILNSLYIYVETYVILYIGLTVNNCEEIDNKNP